MRRKDKKGETKEYLGCHEQIEQEEDDQHQERDQGPKTKTYFTVLPDGTFSDQNRGYFGPKTSF